MPDATQAELLIAYREGDAFAFTRLVHIHQGALLRYAQGLLGSGSGYEDVVQEAFLRLAQSPPDLTAAVDDKTPEPDRAGREHSLLSSWLHKVTRNLCMDAIRSETRRRRRERDVAAPEASSGGLERVDAQDTRAAVEHSLQTLPDDQREVLVLRLLGEKSYREIADITGRKIGTVGWLVSVGMKALGRELAPLLQGGPRENPALARPNTTRLAQGEL